MKNLIWIACCLLAACRVDSGSTVPHPPPRSVCGDMYDEVKSHLPAGTFDVEVDVENVGGTANDGYDYSAVCSAGNPLPPSKPSPPGTIEITTKLTPVIFVRVTPSAGIDFKSYAASGNLADPAALIDGTARKPKPLEWSNCVGRQITGFQSSSHHFIFFPLCPAGAVEKDYTYAVILRNALLRHDDQLDPQIIHHP